MASKTAEERIALIKENLAEFLNPEIIENIVNEGHSPRIYWGKVNWFCGCREYPGMVANEYSFTL